ncbi:hypothetical protein EIP86_002715 [Pleurotus ostreatoroseus]|nr:hypothetical protein EIP86_002715 [Pleurotus ostreatoroseus]
MEFTYAPDFVVSRRRKRSAQKAIDPSLGYYMTLLPQAQTAQNFDAVAPQAVSSSSGSGNITSTLGLPGGCSNLDLPPEKSDILQRPPKRKQQDRVDQVTVEDFLQWSVQPAKKRTTRHFVDLGTSADSSRCPAQSKLSLSNNDDDEYLPGLSDYDEEDQAWASDATDDCKSKHKPKKRKQKAELFSTRLLRAAVVSGVDVDEANDVVSLGGRRPLKFDTKFRLSAASSKKTATRKYGLIHPSKIRMPEGPDFPLLKKLRPVDPIAAGYKPMSYWQPFPLSSAPKMPEKGKTSRPTKRLPSRKGPPYIAPVQPLKLVPGLKAACEAVRLRDAQ